MVAVVVGQIPSSQILASCSCYYFLARAAHLLQMAMTSYYTYKCLAVQWWWWWLHAAALTFSFRLLVIIKRAPFILPISMTSYIYYLRLTVVVVVGQIPSQILASCSCFYFLIWLLVRSSGRGGGDGGGSNPEFIHLRK